jgi:AraC-like DNA-binding protein
LYEVHDSARQIALLNAFFTQRLCVYPQHTFVRLIAQQIEGQRGETIMRDLSVEVGYSIRTVDRLFRQYFGISPKFYARIVRFRRALVLLARPDSATLTDIALAAGYYDLSHFSKECSALAGLSAEACRQFVLTKTQAPPPLIEFLTEQNY